METTETKTNDLPTSVKVGHKTYRIEDWTPQEASTVRQFGDTAHSLCRIRIDTSFGLPTAAETLLHEILHAVWWVWGIDDEDKQERTVGATSNGLATVIRDNPELFAWISHSVSAS